CRIVFREIHEHADAPHPLRLLRPRCKRPRRRPAENLMNSRRLIVAPGASTRDRINFHVYSEAVVGCPLWVKSGLMQCNKACPLYPRKRTCAMQRGMSALGQKRTSRRLFNYLVGASMQSCWHIKTEGLGGLEIDHQFVLGRRLHREVARLFALEDAIDVAG